MVIQAVNRNPEYRYITVSNSYKSVTIPVVGQLFYELAPSNAKTAEPLYLYKKPIKDASNMYLGTDDNINYFDFKTREQADYWLTHRDWPIQHAQTNFFKTNETLDRGLSDSSSNRYRWYDVYGVTDESWSFLSNQVADPGIFTSNIEKYQHLSFISPGYNILVDTLYDTTGSTIKGAPTTYTVDKQGTAVKVTKQPTPAYGTSAGYRINSSDKGLKELWLCVGVEFEADTSDAELEYRWVRIIDDPFRYRLAVDPSEGQTHITYYDCHDIFMAAIRTDDNTLLSSNGPCMWNELGSGYGGISGLAKGTRYLSGQTYTPVSSITLDSNTPCVLCREEQRWNTSSSTYISNKKNQSPYISDEYVGEDFYFDSLSDTGLMYNGVECFTPRFNGTLPPGKYTIYDYASGVRKVDGVYHPGVWLSLRYNYAKGIVPDYIDDDTVYNISAQGDFEHVDTKAYADTTSTGLTYSFDDNANTIDEYLTDLKQTTSSSDSGDVLSNGTRKTNHGNKNLVLIFIDCKTEIPVSDTSCHSDYFYYILKNKISGGCRTDSNHHSLHITHPGGFTVAIDVHSTPRLNEVVGSIKATQDALMTPCLFNYDITPEDIEEAGWDVSSEVTQGDDIVPYGRLSIDTTTFLNDIKTESGNGYGRYATSCSEGAIQRLWGIYVANINEDYNEDYRLGTNMGLWYVDEFQFYSDTSYAYKLSKHQKFTSPLDFNSDYEDDSDEDRLRQGNLRKAIMFRPGYFVMDYYNTTSSVSAVENFTFTGGTYNDAWQDRIYGYDLTIANNKMFIDGGIDEDDKHIPEDIDQSLYSISMWDPVKVLSLSSTCQGRLNKFLYPHIALNIVTPPRTERVIGATPTHYLIRSEFIDEGIDGVYKQEFINTVGIDPILWNRQASGLPISNFNMFVSPVLRDVYISRIAARPNRTYSTTTISGNNKIVDGDYGTITYNKNIETGWYRNNEQVGTFTATPLSSAKMQERYNLGISSIFDGWRINSNRITGDTTSLTYTVNSDYGQTQEIIADFKYQDDLEVIIKKGSADERSYVEVTPGRYTKSELESQFPPGSIVINNEPTITTRGQIKYTASDPNREVVGIEVVYIDPITGERITRRINNDQYDFNDIPSDANHIETSPITRKRVIVTVDPTYYQLKGHTTGSSEWEYIGNEIEFRMLPTTEEKGIWSEDYYYHYGIEVKDLSGDWVRLTDNDLDINPQDPKWAKLYHYIETDILKGARLPLTSLFSRFLNEYAKHQRFLICNFLIDIRNEFDLDAPVKETVKIPFNVNIKGTWATESYTGYVFKPLIGTVANQFTNTYKNKAIAGISKFSGNYEITLEAKKGSSYITSYMPVDNVLIEYSQDSSDFMHGEDATFENIGYWHWTGTLGGDKPIPYFDDRDLEKNLFTFKITAEDQTNMFDINHHKVQVGSTDEKEITPGYVWGYHNPEIKLNEAGLGIFRTDENGVTWEKPQDNVYITIRYKVDFASIGGDNSIYSMKFILGDEEKIVTAKKSGKDYYEVILGEGEIDFLTSYDITFEIQDDLMHTLSIDPIKINLRANPPIPLSLLHTDENIFGAGLATSASKNDKIILGIDSAFSQGTNLTASKLNGGLIEPVRRKAYDVVRRGGHRSVNSIPAEYYIDNFRYVRKSEYDTTTEDTSRASKSLFLCNDVPNDFRS